ncbi:hypothetical protein [Dapis sp. BLCC M172]|uniref:hypothetical protein n=1 Tax=Dapis sp. BLCC M172 TaxID=2975281 RepID=UPI003CEE1681
MNDKGWSNFLSGKSTSFLLDQAEKVSILGRLWQKNHSYTNFIKYCYSHGTGNSSSGNSSSGKEKK